MNSKEWSSNLKKSNNKPTEAQKVLSEQKRAHRKPAKSKTQRGKDRDPRQMDNSMRTEDKMSERTNPSSSDSDAKFLGWQKTGSGEVFALYNITAADHPSFGSTVTEKGLQKLNLRVPATPLPQGPVNNR